LRISTVVSRRYLPVTLLSLLVVVFVAAGTVLSRDAAPPDAGEAVVVLSPHWEGITKEFNWGFGEWLKRTEGVEAHIEPLDVGGGTRTILRYIESSFRNTPESINVDVLFGGGAVAHSGLARHGLLQRARLPRSVRRGLGNEIAGIELHDPGGYWYGAALSGFGIVWNKPMVERLGLPSVSDWTDLTNPRLYGWIASGDPGSSGSVHATFEVILQAYGFEKGYATITQIAGNVAAFDEGGNVSSRAVALGQCAYGLSIDLYAWEQVGRLGEEAVGFTMPEKHTVITPDPISILKGAPNRDLAEKFVEYVLSEDGQKLWYLEPGAAGGPRKHSLRRLPVRRSLYGSGLETSVTVNPFTWGGGFSYDAALDRRRAAVLEDLMRATILDVHAELREAWRALMDAGEPPHLVAAFARAPVTGVELLELASEVWPDPMLRDKVKLEWSRFAREKFRRVCEAAKSPSRVPVAFRAPAEGWASGPR
jgi:ABC-type Fe3+ transport system substrate-binding protein